MLARNDKQGEPQATFDGKERLFFLPVSLIGNAMIVYMKLFLLDKVNDNQAFKK